MHPTRMLATLILSCVCSSPASAGGLSIGAPRIIGISPGLSQRCLQKLDVKAQGAAAARAVHECRKPVGPQAAPRVDPSTAAAVPIKQP